MDAFWNKNLMDLLDFIMINMIVFGFMGNILCFKIFSCSHLRKLPISVFFCFISVYDSICLVNAVIYFLLRKFSWNMALVDDFFCKINNYIIYANGPISAYLMVVVSFERFLSIRFPRRFNYLFKPSFQVVMSVSIIIYNYIFYSFMIWNTVLVAGME